MHGACMICMEMCGSGQRRLMVLAVFSVVVATVMMRLTASRITGTGTVPISGTTASASASSPLGQENNCAKKKRRLACGANKMHRKQASDKCFSTRSKG